jgi:RNA polymerase sigma factor (sigma-70 family)
MDNRPKASAGGSVASNRTSLGISHLLRTVRAHDAEGQSDGQLLRQFLARHDEATFVALVKRHGAMVLGVCRRVLRNEADAEDAFQATFLVLVRKAGSLASRAVLGDWLHGVARRTALNAKRLAVRRRAKEQAMARPEAQGEGERDDWLPLLDEELSRLPEKYRLPIVLCGLEGRTRREAAEQLRWPEGTVAGRLARGRLLLAKQLARHGLALSAGSLAAGLSARSAAASLPTSLVASTAKAASRVVVGRVAAGVVSMHVASLTERTVRDMFVAKLKVTAVLVLVLAGLGGGVAFVHRALAAEQSSRQADSVPGANLADRERDKPVTGKESIVWGGAVNGLRAGLRFQGKTRPYHVGERVSFVFILGNVSDKPIQVAYHKNPFYGGGNPTVLDVAGRAARMLHLTLMVPPGPIVHVTLAPGKTTELGRPHFTIKPADWAGETVGETTLCVGPGTYKVRQKFFLKGQEADEWTGELTSGDAELLVGAGPPDEERKSPASDARSEAARDKDAVGRVQAADGQAPKLVDIATRHPRFAGDFYGWLSTDALLLALPDKDYPRGKLVRRNLTTGEETPLPALTKLYNKADGGCIPQISPDGQWVLWWDMKIHDVSIYGARLDGSGSFRVPKAKAQWDNLYLFWLTDSRHFVELALTVSAKGQQFTRALTRSVDKPNVAESLPIPESSPLQAACCFAGTDIALAAGDRLVALPWGLRGYGGVEPQFTIGEAGVGPNGKPDRTSTVSAPPGSTLRCGAAISPCSDCIAWLAAKNKKGGGTIVSIWVSRLDGSDWRELGWQEAPDPDIGFGDHLGKFMAAAPGGLLWLPDGKTLSFSFKGDLYTIPVTKQFQRGKDAKASLNAVYLVDAQGGQIRADDLKKHPEVKVVHSFADFKRFAETRTALWIDKNAVPRGEKEVMWFIQAAQKEYPFVLIGCNEPLYSFREMLDCFMISGPGPIDWTKYKLEPGFSITMQKVEKVGRETHVTGFMRGYKEKPTVELILAVTDRLLAGDSVPESP